MTPFKEKWKLALTTKCISRHGMKGYLSELGQLVRYFQPRVKGPQVPYQVTAITG